MDREVSFDERFDVVVVGSGAGGMAAALTARAAGLTVLVVEKTDAFGGSTAVSGGAVWIPGNPHMAEVGHADSREAVTAYLARAVGNRARSDLMTAYLDRGPEMVRFLEANTAVRLAARAYSPDYKPELEGASFGGRTLDPVEYDGRRLGRWFDALRKPIPQFLALGGMMVGRKDIDALLGMGKDVAKARHAGGLLARYARDRLAGWPRGTRLLMGNALAAMLLESAVDAGLDQRRGTPVEALVRDPSGRIAGVRLGGATPRMIGARRAVVLATGGFPQSRMQRSAHLPHADVHRSMAPAGNAGDGLSMALAVGAVLETENVGPAFWAPVSVLKGEGGRETVFPHLIMDRQKPGLVAVNAAGRRFVNEATSYHEFVAAMHRTNAEVPSIPAHLVVDRRFLRRYGLGAVRPAPYPIGRYLEAGYLIEAPTIAALAAKIGVPADALAATVAQMNAAAAAGEDPVFDRGRSAYDRYLGDPTHAPNPCLGPIATPPFYAVAVWPGDIGTAVGLKVDASARVLGADDRPIAGLFACGNDMNSIMAGTYPAAGITLGPALTFGYIAGRAIAGADSVDAAA